MTETNEKFRNLLIQYGSAAAEAMSDFPCKFFQTDDCIGMIAYRLDFQCAVIFGDPICPPEETAKLTEAFHKYCHELHLNIIYIIASEKFAKWAKRCGLCKISLAVCEEQILDPAINPSQKHSKLRHKIDRAIKQGLTMYEYVPFDANIENSLTQVGIKWQQAIKGPHIYLGHLNFFETYTGARWFYIKDKELITSMLMLRRLESPNGWLLKFLVTLPDAFRGSSELLMKSVMEKLESENCHYLTRGMAPIDALKNIEGLGHVSSATAKVIYKLISWVFQFAKRKEYWLKYEPQVVPAYLLIAEPHIGLNEIRALKNAFRIDRQGH